VEGQGIERGKQGERKKGRKKEIKETKENQLGLV